MIKLIIFLKLFFVTNLYALELKCNFEEVYADSTVQRGFFLIKNQKLRYQYNAQNLFTIFHNDGQFYLVKNNDKEVINKLDENTEIVQELLNIANKYPLIEKEYKSDDIVIKIEKKLKGDFLKRISIITPKVKMSVYLNNCQNVIINDRFFIHNPFFNYEFN